MAILYRWSPQISFKAGSFIDAGEYILKTYSNDMIEFIPIDNKTLINTFDFDITLPTTEEEKDLMRKQHKQVTETMKL